MKNAFTVMGRIRSMRYALRGILLVLKSEQNAWVHAVATIIVCFLGFYFEFKASEWCWIVIATVAVWVAEALNTAIELLADAASPEFHPLVGRAKDVAAGAVLIAAMGSLIIGVLIIGPYVVAFFRS